MILDRRCRNHCEVNFEKGHSFGALASDKPLKLSEKVKPNGNFSFDSATTTCGVCFSSSSRYSSKDRRKKKAEEENCLKSFIMQAAEDDSFSFLLFSFAAHKKRQRKHSQSLIIFSLFFSSSCVFFTFFQQTQKLSFVEIKNELKMGKIAYFKLMLISISLGQSIKNPKTTVFDSVFGVTYSKVFSPFNSICFSI
jgi:hypothetical protein